VRPMRRAPPVTSATFPVVMVIVVPYFLTRLPIPPRRAERDKLLQVR
jgi:hypothetical protein